MGKFHSLRSLVSGSFPVMMLVGVRFQLLVPVKKWKYYCTQGNKVGFVYSSTKNSWLVQVLELYIYLKLGPHEV